MKYIVLILAGAVLIGLLLSFAVYSLFGENPGYFFAKFIAAPVGLLASGFLFLLYDSLWPRQSNDDPSGDGD